MSSEERKKILQMVEEGKISAGEAAELMRVLEADSVEAETKAFDAGPSSGYEGSGTSAAEFGEVKARALRFAMIPLWTGIGIAVLSAWGIFAIQQNAGVNFWFFCLMFPLMLGVLLIAIGAGGPGSKWLYVNIDRRYTEEWPKNITLGFPLPLGLTSWFLRSFGHNIHGMENMNVDGIIEVLNATGQSGEPFIVNVDDNESGERVQVYIG
jgi:hypothetical protein